MEMNQPDANYWLSLAAQWIQSKSQTQMSFPNYPFSTNSIPQAPEPPRISSTHDATANDNLVEADMDIEDVKEDEQEPCQIWANWQQISNNEQPNIKQQSLPVVSNNHAASPTPQKFLSTKHQQSNRNESFGKSRFVQIPSAPIIGQISESSQSVDMILDSEDDDNSSSMSTMEAQKRKKLPVWIREGLERIEREKKQEIMRIEKEKELKEDEAHRKKIMEEALKELESEKITKSKYVSLMASMMVHKCKFIN